MRFMIAAGIEEVRPGWILMNNGNYSRMFVMFDSALPRRASVLNLGKRVHEGENQRVRRWSFWLLDPISYPRVYMKSHY